MRLAYTVIPELNIIIDGEEHIVPIKQDNGIIGYVPVFDTFENVSEYSKIKNDCKIVPVKAVE